MRNKLHWLLALAFLACADVDGEPLSTGEDVVEGADKVSWESFACTDEYGNNCGPFRWTNDNRQMQLNASHWTDFGSEYGKSDFYVRNTSGAWRQIVRDWSTGSTDAVQWTIAFPSGSPCNTGGNCLFSICLDGVACYESVWKSGATNMANGVWFAPYQTRRFTMYYRVLNGGPTHTVEERMNVWHTPL